MLRNCKRYFIFRQFTYHFFWTTNILRKKYGSHCRKKGIYNPNYNPKVKIIAKINNIYTKMQRKTRLYSQFLAKKSCFGGQRWIRTTEVEDVRFTVWSIWPLWNLPIFRCSSFSLWSRWLDSNPQPADYKSAALPIELHRRVVPWGGIEPSTDRFSVCCSTNWAIKANVATQNGLEPSTSSVTGWRSNQLSYWATKINRSETVLVYNNLFHTKSQAFFLCFSKKI